MQVNLSRSAGENLIDFKSHLENHPGWFHRSSHSIVIEYLIWHWHQTASDGPGFKGFEPRTKPGRPASHWQVITRPAELRKRMEKDMAADKLRSHDRSHRRSSPARRDPN